MKKVDIGFDIGIASVGWAIVDAKTSEIVLHGSRLFDTVDDKKDSKLKNEKRREMRSARRQKNRRITLKRDFIKFLIESKFVEDIKLDSKNNFVDEFREKYINVENTKNMPNEFRSLTPVFWYRKKGLSEKLNKQELIKVLYWYILHRGFKYELVGEETNEEVKLLPIDEQLNYFKEYGFLNGNFNRRFHQKHYLKEINKILSNQKLDKSFVEKFIKFFKRQRSFEEGPGNHKTYTQYGVGLKNYVLKEGVYRPSMSIWEKTIGKGTIYTNEFRAPKASATSQLFNLINDLNNIRVNGNRLPKEIIYEAIEISFQNNKNITKIISLITKKLDVTKNDLRGFRENKNGELEITKQETVFAIAKKLNMTVKVDDIVVDNIFDDIANVLSKTKILNERINQLSSALKKRRIEVDNEIIQYIAKLKGFSGTHSLSYKGMREMVPLLIEEGINQSEYIHKYKKEVFEREEKLALDKNKWLESLIASPTVKRSIRQSLLIFEHIILYAKDNNFEIRDIVIEMARESRNTDARKNEIDRQSYYEEMNKIIDQYIPLSTTKTGKSRLREKIWLWKQQMGCDAYDGTKIDIDYLINNVNKFDIESYYSIFSIIW